MSQSVVVTKHFAFVGKVETIGDRVFVSDARIFNVDDVAMMLITGGVASDALKNVEGDIMIPISSVELIASMR